MRRVALLFAFCVAVSACAGPRPPTGSPAPSETKTPGPPPATTPLPSLVIACGDLPAAECRDAARAALAAVAGQSATPTRVELSSGLLCEGFLFSDMPCRQAVPPGGQLIGGAVVSFAGSSSQGYMNLAKDASSVHALFTVIATPPPAASPS
jgi:hypothetical protein